jgi:hypothetical protein
VLESDTSRSGSRDLAHLNPEFGTLFDEMLSARVDRLAAEPRTSRRSSRR